MLKKILTLCLLLLFISPLTAEEKPTETPPEIPKQTLPYQCGNMIQMLSAFSDNGFMPIFMTEDRSISMIVLVQPISKQLAVIVFQPNAENLESANACLIHLQNNLTMGKKNFESLADKMIGRRI